MTDIHKPVKILGMIGSFSTFLDTYISVFFIFNAFMNVFIVISFTPHMNFKQRQKTIAKSVIVALCAVCMFAIIGKFLLDTLDVTTAAMKLTGAILIGPAAYDMVIGHSIDNENEHKDDLHFFPIGIPTLAGPGVFTTVLSILKDGGPNSFVPNTVGIVCAVFSVYVILSIGNRLFSKINATYMRMISIFSGILLMALSAQFLVDAILLIANYLKY